jgi:iron complex outermembrane recepter protein
MVKNSAIVALSLVGGVMFGQGAIANDSLESQLTESLPQANQAQPPATTVKEWVAQIEAATVQVTNIKLEPTQSGLDIILDTAEGKPLQVDATKFRTEGNNWVADLPNAALALPDGQSFVAENPAVDIAQVQVAQQDASTIRVTVVGKESLPKTEVTLKTGGLAYSLNPEADESDEEIVVTGEGQGYRVPNTSVGTKTDTPLRDIPQSIQVVPQEVIKDQQLTRLDDALRNVPGVSQDFNSGPYVTYRIRGFEALNNNLLRNGQIDAGAGESVELTSVDRVEVLKGPASVLFGLGFPGGSINIVTKRPLSNPFYAIDATAGNYSFYRGAVDLSGPLNRSKTVLYRLNVAYRNSGSFIDFYSSDNLSVSPVVSIAIGKRTNLIIEGDYIKTRDSGFMPFVPPIGSVLPNPNGRIPRNRNIGEPTDEIDGSVIRVGYQLEHKLNDNWSLRNSFAFNSRTSKDKRTLPRGLNTDNRTLDRIYREFDFQSQSFTLATNAVGKFSTGSIQHQLLFGVDLSRVTNSTLRFLLRDAPTLDIFAPVYGKPLGAITFGEVSDINLTDSLGIYLQDQIALTNNLKLLIGGRFDIFSQKFEDITGDTESTGSGSAFSPRLGIVYQPISAISLYASYVRSFTPVGGTFFSGDATLKPERGTQYEVGVKADLSSRLSTTLALFDLTRTNVPTADPNNPDFQIQVGKQKSQGIEVNLAGEILPGWKIFAGYAYIDARVTEDNTLEPGDQLPNVPYNSFNLWTSYEIQRGNLKGLGLGLGLFYVGDRSGDLPNTYDIPSYLRTDAAIYYKRDRFRVGLNFRNLFDIRYFENGSSATRVNYGQPFTVQGNVSWQF